jgi:hypothetical protein
VFAGVLLAVKVRFVLMALVALGCSRRAGAPTPSAEAETQGPSFAVVELFTSEGCSSCPPADENLARIAAAAEGREAPVYALSFHVDYWNHLGWRDPFSSEDFSVRQRHYARALRSGVYTPQMVVNGTTEFTGTSESEADDAVDRALARPATAAIVLQPRYDRRTRALALEYRVERGPGNGILNLCVVQSSDPIRVAAGENRGRELVHRNVVRAYETRLTSESSGGTWRITLAPDIDPLRARLVAFVQDSTSFAITGAQGSAL